MRFSSKLILSFASIIMLFNSCKNDLNILAPYKETVSVYAILNPKETRQYVRINKIFQGEGNAYTMATVSDSVNYQQGVLQVSLTRSYNGGPAPTTIGNATKMEIILNDTVIQLQSGPFNSNQRLWFTDDRLYPDGEYHLKIKNTRTGNEFTSTSLMIDSIAQPGIIQPLGPPYYPVAYSPSNPPYYYLDLTVTTLQRKVKFFTMKNARDYACIMRFHYVDYLNNADSIKRTLDYEFSRLSSTTLDGGEQLEFNYTSGEYFNYVYSKISETSPPAGTSVLKRRAVTIEYIITAATQDFADFIKISAPSTSVAQDKPAYSNIEGGGFGIFSCRSTYHAPKHLANATIDHMATKKPLCDLLFLNSFGNPGSTCN
jgi:hypothetical protein